MFKIASFLFLLLLPFMAHALKWVTNRDHSEIMFQIPYMGVSEISGRFNEFNGEIIVSDKTKSPESLIVQITSSSIDTGNKMRDNHLRSNDFFQTEQHPYITFKSSDIKSVNPNAFKATGELSIKGTKKIATIEFTSTESLKDTWGYDNKFVKFKSNLNRKDFNIVWNKTLDGQQFLVGDTITYWGTFQIQPSRSKTPNSKHMIPDTEYIRQRDKERIKGNAKEKESGLSQKLRKLINGK